MKINSTVLAFGTFDLLHPGHVFFLRFAGEQGGHLTVVVARDTTVQRLKGRPPIHTEEDRKHAIEGLEIADEVVLGDKNDHLKVVRAIKPDVIVLGYDQTYFTEKLSEDLKGMGMENTEIIRAPAFEPKRWKSSKLRQETHSSTSAEDTQRIASNLAAKARPGDIYLLTGQLGAGKTCFMQGFLSAMGVGGSVTSPTYVYETRYQANSGTVYHLDLYRVEGAIKLHTLGIEERLEDMGNILLIEWPEVLEQHMRIPENRRATWIAIVLVGENEREIRITTEGDEGKEKES